MIKRKWEYMTCCDAVRAGPPADKFLNDMDAQGWELVCRAREQGIVSLDGLSMWIFRRPKTKSP